VLVLRNTAKEVSVSTTYSYGKLKRVPKGVVIPERPNLAPTPIVEVTPDEFWQNFSSYGIGSEQSFDQVYNLPGYESTTREPRHLSSVHIMWYATEGYAIRPPESWRLGDTANGEPRVVYTEPVRFYRIGCRHDWKPGARERKHNRHDVCAVCGAEQEFDTSG
jgi:hypothetical protein